MIRVDLEAEGIKISFRKLCEWFEVLRASVYCEPRQRRCYRLDEALVADIRARIDSKPYYGLRRIHWQLNRDPDAL